jgi:hypothetical protein
MKGMGRKRKPKRPNFTALEVQTLRRAGEMAQDKHRAERTRRKVSLAS